MAEEILVSVRIDRPKNQDELTKLTNQIVAQKNEVKQLETAVRTLSKAEGDNSALIKAATKNLEVKKQQLNQNVASQKALVNVINAEVGSLNALKAQNVQLIQQRNKLNVETEEGRAGIQRINAQLDANNAKIRENSSGLEKQKINIGNYQSALAGLSPALGSFITGMQGMVVAAKAFIATPLGLILGAIAVALAPVVSFLTSTGEGMDRVSRETEGFNAVLRTLKDRLNDIGRGQVEGGAADNVANSILNLNKKIVDHIKLLGAPLLVPLQKVIDKYNEVADVGRTYADAIDDIRDSEENYGIEAARTENAIKRLVLESKNRTLSEEERIKKIDEALGLEAQLLLQRKRFAEDELSAIVEYNRKRLEQQGIVQKAEETQADFVANNINSIRDLDEDLATLLINSLKKVEDTIGESITLEERLQNQRDALLDKADEKAKKRAEDRKKRGDLGTGDKDAAEQILEVYNAVTEEQTKIDKKRQDEVDAITQRFLDGVDKRTKAEVEAAKKKKKLDDLEIKSRIEKDKQIRNLENTALQLFKQNTIAYKLIATKQAVMDSYQSASAANKGMNQAFPGPVGIALGIAAAIAQIALGAFRVAQINGVKFAKGGIVEGRSHAEGGVPFRVKGSPVVHEYEGGEAVINKRSTAMFRDQLSRINEAGGGKAFATGGIMTNETRVAASRAESQFDINQMAGLINQVRTILVLEDFQAKEAEVNSTANRAKVIG